MSSKTKQKAEDNNKFTLLLLAEYRQHRTQYVPHNSRFKHTLVKCTECSEHGIGACRGSGGWGKSMLNLLCQPCEFKACSVPCNSNGEKHAEFSQWRQMENGKAFSVLCDSSGEKHGVFSVWKACSVPCDSHEGRHAQFPVTINGRGEWGWVGETCSIPCNGHGERRVQFHLKAAEEDILNSKSRPRETWKTCSIPCGGQGEDMLHSLCWPKGRHAQFPAKAKRKTCSIPCDGQKEDMLNSLRWPRGRHALLPAVAKGKTCSIPCDGQKEDMLYSLWWSLGETFSTSRDPRGKIGQFPVTAFTFGHASNLSQFSQVTFSQTGSSQPPIRQSVDAVLWPIHLRAGHQD